MYEVFLMLLAKSGLNAADVSRATGIPETTLSNWKRRGRCGIKNGQKIADFFGVSLDYLMTGKDSDGKAPDTPIITNPLIYELIDTANGCDDADIQQALSLLKRLKAYSNRIRELNVHTTTRG